MFEIENITRLKQCAIRVKPPNGASFYMEQIPILIVNSGDFYRAIVESVYHDGT